MKICKRNHNYNEVFRQCPECKKAWNKANPDKVKTTMKKYYEANKDYYKTINNQRYVENKEKIKSDVKLWQKSNTDKVKEFKKTWRKSNLSKCNALASKRRASKLKATPPWLTNEHLMEIEQFYIEARDLQWLSDPTDPFEVDHIIPLQGKNVCGLHVPWNLQIIPTSKNRRKSNKN